MEDKPRREIEGRTDSRAFVKAGDRIECSYCHGAAHTLIPVTDEKTGETYGTALYYVCQGESYMGAIGGRLLPNLREAVWARIW